MNLLRHTAGRAMLLGLVSALMMILAIVLRDEIWNNRTIALVIIWLLGGFLGTFGGVAALLLARRLLGEGMVGPIRSLIFLPAFIVAGAMVFYFHAGWQSGFELHPERPIRSILFGSVQTMAMFVYTVSHYLLPWMAPAMILVGYALMPRPEA
jgi:hypothetical protein